MKCWGANDFGELGYGNTQNIGDNELPSSVGAVRVAQGLTVSAVSVGGTIACAVLSDANLKCWGGNFEGELGQGNTEPIGDNELPSSIAPIRLSLSPGVTVRQVAAGDFHTCALLSDSSVRCWGDNFAGQLGYGNLDRIGDNELPVSAGPVRVTTTPGVVVTQLAAGHDHTCAVLSDGTVKCWGNNEFGQLGQGNTETIGDDELPSSIPPVTLF